MNTVCLYFEVHQPFRVKPYGFFDIGHDPHYLDQNLNQWIVRRVAEKSYMPTTNLLLHLIHELGDDFQITFAVTATALEQFRDWCPEVLDNFKRLADTGRAEFLAETSHHSLSGLFSDREFREQVRAHEELIQREFGQKPRAFRNTELIYSDHVAWLARDMGYKVMLAEGAERLLGGRSPNFVYHHHHEPDLKLLMKNYRLSDDIAFRFSDRNWSEHPLKADTFAYWLHSHAGSGEIINLFMDFETFGEHQWADSGIFEFLRGLPAMVLRHPDFTFRTVSEAAETHGSHGSVSSRDPVSWADTERDVSAWMGNALQRQALISLYEMENRVHASGDPNILEVFRKLQTSDHFYYMCTKYWSDGDVHKYFSPFDSPYDAYVYYMNILHDFRQRLDEVPAAREAGGVSAA